MRKVRIQARAEKDLLGIWDYSFVEWGPTVADQYLDMLDEAIRALVDSPQAGASRGYIRDGCRVLFA
jgi:toxin ParE1/3/4